MELTSIIITYCCCWWILFLMILPLGHKHNSTKIIGHASSAPDEPQLFKKGFVVTILSVPLTFFFLWLLYSGKLSFLLAK